MLGSDISQLAPKVVMRDFVRLVGLTDLFVRPLMAMTQVRELARMLDDPNPAIREMSVNVLGRSGAHGVPGLMAALDVARQPPSVRVAAVQALGMNPAVSSSAQSVAAISRCLSDPDAIVRDQAALAMS